MVNTRINTAAAAEHLFKQLRQSDSISELLMNLPVDTVERYIEAGIIAGIELEKMRVVREREHLEKLKKEN